MQKTIIAGLAGALLWLVAPAWSAENSQQTKMTTCNADAKTRGLTGDDRKAFMKTCLSADAPAPTGNSQQQKMKTCNADATAKGLKGDDRKAYMKTCLSSGS
jgi:psiF repeat